MATKIKLFGNIKVLRKNPWFSGKLYEAVKRGLAKIKKDLVIADLPPWYFDKNSLSDAQIEQIIRFSRVAHRTAGQKMVDRIVEIKREASGPTGKAKPRRRVINIGTILTIARARGLSIPPELEELARATAPAPTPTAQAPVISE